MQSKYIYFLSTKQTHKIQCMRQGISKLFGPIASARSKKKETMVHLMLFKITLLESRNTVIHSFYDSKQIQLFSSNPLTSLEVSIIDEKREVNFP